MLRTLSYDIHDQCRRVIERDSKKKRVFNGADARLQAPEDQIFPSVESLQTAGVYATSANTYLGAHVAFGRRRAKNNGIVAVNPSRGFCPTRLYHVVQVRNAARGQHVHEEPSRPRE
jgi:hypothetical protein